MTDLPRSVAPLGSRHSHPTIRRRVQRFVSHPGSTNSPSEMAIRSIYEKRSTPRW